jgi:predicted Zn finger-like uncharacterized protein
LKLICPDCKTQYDIPEKKIPDKPDLVLKCPSCKGNISVKDNLVDANSGKNNEDKKQEFLKGAKALPPFPEILFKAREIVNDETRDLRDLAEILEKDQAMTARVLKIANSAYYALRTPVSSVQQACVILGAETLLQMITLASTSKLLGKELKGYSISSGEVFTHSLGVAFASRLIAIKTDPFLTTDAFSAGILHDAGKLLIDEHLIDIKDLFIAKVNDGYLIHQVEKDLFGFDHAEIGSDFLKSWNIPVTQADAIRWHHEPSKSGNDPLAYILHIANAVVSLVDDMNVEEHLMVEPGSRKTLGVTNEDLETIRNETKAAIESIFHGFIDK